jgi:phage terminase large subunit-like protein
MNFAPEARQRTEQSRVHHIGTFPELEDQMTSFIADIRPGGFDQRGL